MKKMTKPDIEFAAHRRYTASIMGEGLLNGKKIALEVYRLFKAEALRRKKLEPKRKRKRKVRVKTKTGPPKIL